VSDRPIKLLIIDSDPIFRLGLTAALGSFDDLEVIGQAETPAAARERLAEQEPDIAIIEPNLNCFDPDGWQLCQQIQQQHPQLKILLLSGTEDLPRLNAARKSGVAGYCAKGTSVAEIAAVLRQLAAGQQQWQALTALAGKPQTSPLPAKQWLVRLRQLGLAEIDDNLHQVEQQLNYSQLSLLDRLFWQGRRRELRAARWLVQQILPVEVVVIPNTASMQAESALSLLPEGARELSATSFSLSANAAITFNNTLAKIEGNFNNLSGIPLEIAVLKPDKRRELLYVAWQQVRKSLEKLRFLDLSSEQLAEQLPLVLAEIWRNSTIDFFGKYYQKLNQSEDQNLENIIAQEAEIIQEEILEKIPYLGELFTYFILNSSLPIDKVEYRPESPEAIQRAEFILQNLILKIANGVIAFILNNFSESEDIKKLLYDCNLLSTREIARFRNELSWRYRREKYWEEPRDIFESKYRLLVFQDGNIKTLSIYAPRQQELEQLRGLRWLVTVAWETRDAIAPRLQAIARAIGNALVYLLTQIIGRGIGLIGRGIIQGIGNTFQDVRYNRNQELGVKNQKSGARNQM
jgi:DNA-binding NarL/FixJ family response regulator